MQELVYAIIIRKNEDSDGYDIRTCRCPRGVDIWGKTLNAKCVSFINLSTLGYLQVLMSYPVKALAILENEKGWLQMRLQWF